MAIKYQFIDSDLIYDNLFSGATAEELRAEFEKNLATQVARCKEAKQKQIENARSAFIARFLDYASALDVDIPKEGYAALEADFKEIEAKVAENQKVADIINNIASKTKVENNKIHKHTDDEILKLFFENL
mgnify:CR=1 FL=1